MTISIHQARESMATRLKEARVATGMSTRTAASRLPQRFQVSHTQIAKFEKGAAAPSIEVLDALATLYERPTNWFLQSGNALAGIRYRRLKSRVGVRLLHQYEAKAQHLLEAYVKLEDRLGDPLGATFSLSIGDGCKNEEELALKIRDQLNLREQDPIPKTVSVLEQFGIRVIELSTEERIDGFAARFGNENIVVINPNTANDRCRLNTAHEFGHVLFSDCDAAGGALDDKEIEDRAYALACFLLIPRSQLQNAFEGRSMVRLVEYKERFGISLAAMIYRAAQLRIIPQRVAKWLWMEFAKRGWKVKEPGHVRPDRATRFEFILDSAITRKKITWEQAVAITGIREDELRDRVNLALGIPEEKGGQVLKITG